MAKLNQISAQINSISQMLNIVKLLRVLFFFYAFLCFFFWFLNCFEVEWLYKFNWLFIGPYKMVATFYHPQGVSADFTLAIIGIICVFLGFIMNLINENRQNKIYQLQEEEEKLKKQKRMRAQKRAIAQETPVSSVNEIDLTTGEIHSIDTTSTPVVENSKLVFIITNHINKIKRSKDDLELTFQEVELWNQRVNKKFIENVNYSKPLQKGYYRKNLFLVYKDFNYVDDFIYYIRPTLDSITLEFRKYGVSVSFSYVLSAITSLQTLEKELDCMDTVLSLNFINEIIVTQRFHINYENKVNSQYCPISKGEYNLSKNLSISNRQLLYYLVDKNKKE